MTCCGDQNPGIGINGIWIGSDFETTGKVALGGGGLVQIPPPKVTGLCALGFDALFLLL